VSNGVRRLYRVGNDGIAILPFVGVAVQRTDAYGEALGLLSLWHFTHAFRAALADDSVGGIIIDVDSPGGSAYGVMELADEIYRSRVRKPIFAVANSLAASGAYWIASAAHEFHVTPGGEVGGIGVYDIHTDHSKGLGKAGIETTLISAGRYKVEGNPFQPLSTSGRSAMQARVDGYYRAFVAAIAKNRNVPESAVRNGMGQGRLLDAERAKHENMVDSIATLDDVASKLARRVGQSAKVRASFPSARLRATQHVFEASSHRSSRVEAPTTRRVVAGLREIELLDL
jgi:signal peptide peptidase SppA